MSEELKLLPCPACSKPRMQGGKAVFLCQLDRAWDCGGWWYRAICADCGHRGRAGCSGEEAVKNWNDGIYEEDLSRDLTWTTEPPKVTGFFWAIPKDDCQILNVIKVIDRNGTLLACPAGNPFAHDLSNFRFWAGPIPEPKEPTS